MKETTIVAVASPPGTGGLAVIRLSGPAAFSIAARVFTGPGFSDSPVPRRAVYGILHRPVDGLIDCNINEYAVDQVVALPFRRPHSYTGEDTVEFFCHGGQMVTRAALGVCREAGALPAAAGEFTRRAFVNGKLSLDQAEAVADLIGAQSEQAARAATRQLLGGLDDQLSAIEDPLLGLLARIEGSLEFADDEDAAVPRATILSELATAIDSLDRLLALAPAGRLLRDGVHLVLAGPPNVGKSSLFNALLAEDRAIVDDEAGTTRDVVSARLSRGGTAFVLHDTAGLRSEPGRVERMGIERTRRQLDEADLVLALAEAGQPDSDLDVTRQVPVIRVWTKCDLQKASASEGEVVLSSLTGEGLTELWAAIERVVADFALNEAMELGVVLNERHLHKLTISRDELSRLHDEIAANRPGDEVVGSMLASILAGLGEISGRVFSEQLLGNIFQRFCVGK